MKRNEHMFGETLHCGELIKRLNDALGRKANNTFYYLVTDSA